MNAFSEDLKKEREAKAVTLAEISKKTRINIKYLEAIEQGAFDVLPQTYIRAFIKAYAETIGLDVNEMLRKYDIHVAREYSQDDTMQSQLSAQQQKSTAANAAQILTEHKKMRTTLLRFAAVAAGLIVIIAGIVYWNSPPEKNVTETPFENVVKEKEQQEKPVVTADSVHTVHPASAVAFHEPDSLALRMVAKDSVWITVFRDTLPPRRGYLLGGRYRTYIAQKEFKVSISDAGAMTLYLNGNELPPLASKGTPVRNVTINADYLKRQ